MARRLLLVGVAWVVALVVSASGQSDSKDGKAVKVGPTWGGRLLGKEKEPLRMSAPSKLYVSGPKAFAALWKLWRTEDKIPDVDFTRKLVLVGTSGGPNEVTLTAKLDDAGNLTIKPIATLVGGPGFGYAFGVIDRAGVKTVQGKPLVKEE